MHQDFALDAFFSFSLPCFPMLPVVLPRRNRNRNCAIECTDYPALLIYLQIEAI